MEIPAAYQTSVKFRATGALPSSQLDATGRTTAVQSGSGAGDAQTAEKSSAAAAEQRKDRKSHCIDLLVEGCVDSFVDLLKMAQADEESVAADKDDGTSTKKLDHERKPVDLGFLKGVLERAETSRRAKNYHLAVDAYSGLAEFFEKQDAISSSRYFHHRCLEVAGEAGVVESIATANLNLGTCEEKLGNWENAMTYHETALELSTQSNALPLQIKSALQLCHVYKVLADRFLSNSPTDDDVRAACDLFEKCVACAKLAKDSKLEGTNCHQLGKAKTLSGEYGESIRLQQQYLDICRKQGDRAGEANARSALAQAYEATGNIEEAVLQLELLLTVAAEAGELEAQAKACLSLGLLLAVEKPEKSIALLETHFELVKKLNDREGVDAARVILGMARGQANYGKYMHLVQNDLGALLQWKSRRA
ncbi:unnamed protein product [Amoebophrya sp. A120]|nr:unnamed protein product [Amoebophrya sp. A120]|eukprot:GSA120T00023024001.1